MCLFSVSDLICNPVLATFPQLLDQPDLMDALRVCYFVRISRQNLSFFFVLGEKFSSLALIFHFILECLGRERKNIEEN